MSQLLIQQYLNQLATLKRVSGTNRESVVREAFKDLLKGYARSVDLTFVPEHEVSSPAKERRYVDGALMHTLRVPFGYWEAQGSLIGKYTAASWASCLEGSPSACSFLRCSRMIDSVDPSNSTVPVWVI